MDIEMDQEHIIMKFKRNGHNINKNSLNKILEYLKKSQSFGKGLDGLVKRVNEMSISSNEQSK